MIWGSALLALAVGTWLARRRAGSAGVTLVAMATVLGVLGGPAMLAQATLLGAVVVATTLRPHSLAYVPAAAGLAIVTLLFGGWYAWSGPEPTVSPSRAQLAAAYPALADARLSERVTEAEVAGELAIVDWTPEQVVVGPGQSVAGTVTVQVRRPTATRAMVVVRASDSAGAVPVTGDFDLGASTWSRGLSAGDSFPLPVVMGVSDDVPSGAYSLEAHVFELPGRAAIPLTDPRSGAPSRALLGHLLIARPGELAPAGQPEVGTPPIARFDAGLDLVAASVRCAPASAGGCRVSLRWLKREPVGVRYTVFAQLVERSGAVVGQSDSYPLAGRLPTDVWPVGYVLSEERTLAGVRPVEGATVHVGLYLVETMQRARIVGPGGSAGADHVVIPVWPE
jgi:hypothetical protein